VRVEVVLSGCSCLKGGLSVRRGRVVTWGDQRDDPEDSLHGPLRAPREMDLHRDHSEDLQPPHPYLPCKQHSMVLGEESASGT